MKRITLIFVVFFFFPVHAYCLSIGGDVDLALSLEHTPPSESWYVNSFTVTTESVLSFTFKYTSDEFLVFEESYSTPSSEWVRFTVGTENSYPGDQVFDPPHGAMNLWSESYYPTFMHTFTDPNTDAFREVYSARNISNDISIDLSSFLGQTISFGWTFCITDGGPGPYGQWELSNLSLNEIPEPSTMLLLAIGIVGLAGYRKYGDKRIRFKSQYTN